MYFTVPIQRTNDDGYKVDVNGLDNITLRKEPDFDIDLYSLTAVPNENGVYENTTSITEPAKYKMFINGVEEKSWGGTRGRNIITDESTIKVDEFNVGETLVVQNVDGEKRFVPTSLTGAVSDEVISSISSSLVSLQPKVWVISANIIDAGGDSVDLDTITYKSGHAGVNMKVQQLDRSDINPGSYLIYTQPNAPIFNNKTIITFSEVDDEDAGGDLATYSYKPTYPFISNSTTEVAFRIFDSTGTTPLNPTKQVLIKIEVYS